MANLSARAPAEADKTRAQLIQKFAELFLVDFTQNGAAAIETVRMQFPATYLRLIATLRSGNHETNPLQDLTDDELVKFLTELPGIIRAAAGTHTGTDPPPGIQSSSGVSAISQAN